MLAKNSFRLNEYNFESINMRNDKIFTRFQKILKSISIFILLAIPLSGFAQYDYEHYVPPFYCSSQVGKQEVFLSTNSEKDINVYIEDGQGNKIAGPFTVNRNHSETYVFRTPSGATYSKHSNYYYPDGCSYSYGIIGPKELNKPLDGHGLRIFSYDGPFFANIRHGYSNRGEGRALTHGFSLSAKGAYAKGKEFYSGHLYGHTILNGDPLDYYSYRDTRPIRSHSISVMAVEDGVTTVTFSGIKCKYITKYEGGKVVLKSITPNETVTVNLNKGQTYTLGTNLHSDQFGSESIEVRNGMNGTHITSTKDIVVNSGSWTAGAKPSQDIGFDQIVPVDQVRDKYIVMKGQGRAEPDPTAYHAGQERTIVVATKANTEIWVNEVFKGELAEPGDFMILDDIVNPDDIPTLFINSKGKDIYVYQTMCGTNEDWINIGLNFIPPLTALGMKEVVIPKAKQITSGDYISPTVTVLAQKNVNVKHNGTTLNDPKDILGSTEWVYYTVSGISGDSRFTGDKAINVAWTASSNTLGAAGYYSGFTKAVSPIHPELNIETDLSLICESYDDDIIVSIKDNTGRDPDFYEWYKEVVNIGGETEWEGPNFINSSLKIPAPNENTTWQVRAYYRDPSLEILFNGDFLDGYNGFDSYYELVTNNLVDPGQFAITGRPKDENPILNDFNPIGGWKMLLAYSKNQNDTIYRSAEMEVESKFNYIFKMHGRLAKSDAADIQSLKVLINNETIVENFRIDRSDQWQSVSALWRPNGARNASIKILNNNLNGEGTFFAIDSISFVQAVEDTDLFEAKVIPNYSYSNNGKTFQFCEGVQNSLDVSNGDTSWYSYSWSKKDVAGNYIDLDDVAGEFSGTKTHELIFLNPHQDDEGDYRCKISFKEDYKNCGTSSDDVHVDLSVLVDEPATVRIDADKTNFCFGTSANLNALVTGDAGQVKWYVNGGDDPVSLENPFVFSGYDAGTYVVRCEAENGCGLAFDEVTLEVLSAPVLNSLTVNPDLCENKDIILTANATGNGTIVYNWKEGTTDLTEQGSILKFPATMAHRDLTYSVSATSVYTTVDGRVECTGDLTIPIDNLDIYPNVTITDPLKDANLCEGNGNHIFSVLLSQPESFYNFTWQKGGADLEGDAAQKIITPIELSDAGEYKVTVSNRCDTKSSIANLTVVPKMVVNGITPSAIGPFCSPTNVTVTFNDNGAVAEYKAKKPDDSEIVITNPYTFEVNTTSEGTWEFIAVPNCVGDPVSQKFTWNLIPDFGAVSMEDKATCIGKDVDFVVEVKDVLPLSELTYEWKDNTNTTIVGENTNFLSLMNVQDADLGQYKCIVTDQCGNSKTATANLSIEKVTTSTIGTAIEKCVGDTDFRIDIAYTGTPNFEWSFENKAGDVTILSESTGSLTVNPVTVNDAGIYYCAVTLTCGDVVNIQRELIVHEHVSIVSPADETIHICQGEQPVLNIEVNGDADIYTVSWTNNTDNPLVGFGDVNQVQLSKHDIPGTYTYKAKVTSLGNCDNLEKKYFVQVHEKPILSTIDNNVNKCAGLVELKITESGEHNGISWWKNGALVTDGNTVATDFVINPAASPDDDGTYAAKVSSDYCGDNQVSINLDVKNNIVITAQSSATSTVCENDEVSLFVTANAGGDEIHYKWYKEIEPGTILSDQPTYSISNAELTQAGTYKVELYDDLSCGNQTLSFDVVVNKNPTVTNPSDKIICETETSVDFIVSGDAQGGANYQWYNSAGEIVGATSATYTETTLVDGETYYCEVTGIVGSCGTATSGKATLTIIKEVAVTNPLDITIDDGADAKFSVIASGEPNYSYQWQVFDGTWKDINNVDKYSGTQTSELKIANADKATYNGKQYRCVVVSDGTVCSSSATSDFATLTILVVNKIAVQPSNQVVCEGEDIVFTVTGTKTKGLTYQWQYHTGDDNFQNAKLENDVEVSTYTISGATQDMENWEFRCLVSDGVSTPQPSNEVSVDVWENIVVATALTNTIIVCEDSPLSLTVDATAGEKIKYEWTKLGSGTVLQTGSVLNLGNAELAESGTYTCKVYNDQNCNNVNIVYNVTVQENAKIKLHPVDKAICESDVPVSFDADGTAEGTVTYEWFDKGGNSVGTTKTLTIAANPENGQSYYCVVSGDVCNSATTNVANLTVYEEVVITDPSDQTSSDGESVSFSVSATGEPTIEYKWYEKTPGGVWTALAEGGIYSGVSTASLTIDPVSLSMNTNQYKCEAWSSTCSAVDESDFATLTILAVNKIVVQPSNEVVCEGEDIEFTVTGTKTAGQTYQWQYHTGDNLFVDANIADVSTVDAVSTYTIANASQAVEAWGVRCIVKDGSSADDISNEVKVKVYEPVIFTDIDNQALCFDESKQITLDVTAGTTPLTYSWTKDAIEVSTTAIVNIGTGDNGNYEVTVGNGVCPDVSDDFTVVHHSQLSLKAWTNSSEYCVGSLETLSVSVQSFDPALTLSYKWYKDGGEIPGAINADYTFTPVDKSESGQYKVEVFDGCSTEYISGYVSVYEPVVTANNWADPDAICIGSELNLEVDVTGDVKSYTWTHNGNSITATTNYLVAAVTDLDAGSYQCIVEDHCGNTFTYTTNITIMHAPSIDGDGIENLIAVCEGDPLVLGTVSVTGSYDDIEWTLKDGSTNSVAGVQLNLGDATTAMEGNYKVEVSNKCGSDISVGAQVVNPKPTLAPIANQTVCENEDVVFRAKATGRDLIYQWKIDGITQPSSIATLLISGVEVLPEDAFTPKVYTVECIVTDDNGCGGTLIEITQLTVNPSTIILATLKNVVRFVGQDYTMTVDATGHNLSYTWTHVKDGVTTNLSEKTNSLTLTNIQFADEGYYNCEINGTCATRLATGKITVKEPVVITDGLVSLEEKCVGEPLSLSISATGQISSVKWFKDGFEIPGETNLTLYVAELKAGDAGVYTCKVEGEGAPVDGIVEKTTVRVYENTTLLAALGAKTICEGEELEWIPNVKGAANIKYKWFFGGVEVSDQKILNYNPTQLAHEGNYEVQVTGLCGNVTTTGNLEVTELPVVISVSDNVETCENTSLIEFSVSATGEELKYQWRKDGIDIVGKTSPVLSLTSIQLTDEANYTCKVYNSCSDVISDEMTLKVIPQLRILSEMADIEVCSGEEVMLTTDVEGNDVIYQWKLDGVDLTGENTSVLNLGKTSPDNSGYYTCIVSDRCTDSRSTKPTELTVHELPNSRILGRMVLCAKEDRVTYTTDAIPEIEYGWGVEGGLFAGPDKGLRTRVTWGELEDGELSIMITDVATGCESKVDSLVKLNALPDVNLALFESKGVCNESFTLSGGYPEGGIYWVDDISEEVFNPAEKGAGTYNIHYSYTDENGCSNVTSKTTLQVDPLPTVNITDDTTIGSCKPFKLSAETDESNIQWSPAADLDDANSMTPTFTPGKSQVLVATVMDEHGCTNMDLVELTVAPLPIVTTISDTTVGQCNQLQLLTDIVGDAGEITWTNPDHLDNPNTRSPRIVNAPEGTYTYKISVTDLYGCDAEGEVLVNMVADPELEEDKFACEGEKFEVNIAGMENPIWEDGYTDINRTIDQPGKYLLTVENKYGCGDDQNFVINPTPKPELLNNLIFSGPREIELVKDRPITIFEGQTVTLAPNLPLEYSPYYFEWEDGKEGSILQRYEVSETGKYKLTVRDNLGCIAKDSVNVEVKPVGIESPNAFTPNSSNDNDKFYLKDINYDIEQFEMYVYNRWGELLYKTDEVGRNGGWDGKYKGKLCPAGAYVWMVFINGELTNKGTFMLIR